VPPLANPRHELFVQRMIDGERNGRSQGQIYKSCGYGCSNAAAEAAASRLLKDVKVQNRIDELLRRGAKRAETTINSLLAELEHVRFAASNAEQFSAAVSAITSKAKLAGLWVDKAEIGGPGDFAGCDTVEKVMDKARQELGNDAAELMAAMLADDARDKLVALDRIREDLIEQIMSEATLIPNAGNGAGNQDAER
jgi:Terminase small subunit